MQNFRALTKYLVVGAASNTIVFLFYLILTSYGLPPKGAITACFAVGVLQTFVFNRRWTFGHDGEIGIGFVKYIFAYLLAYVLNLTVLLVFVDYLGYPHQWVQGVSVLGLAGFLFVVMRCWVFAPS